MTICSACNGIGRIDTLQNELCAFCGGTGKYSANEDSRAISMLDDASAEEDIKAGGLAAVADYYSRLPKRRD